MNILKSAGEWLASRPWRILAVTVALTVLPLGVFVAAAHDLFVREVTARTVAASAQQGRVFGLVIEQHLTQQRRFVESIALRPDVVSNWASSDYARLTATLDQLRSLHPDFFGFGVCDVRGVLRVSSPPPQAPAYLGQDLTSRPWYAPVAAAWRPYVSPVFNSVRAGKPLVVAIAVPIFVAGKPSAILVAAQTLDEVAHPVYSLLSPENYANVTFVDQQHQVFGAQRGSAHIDLMSFDPAALSALMNDRPGTGRVLQIGGKEHIAEYSPIASLGWGVLIQAPSSLIGPAVWSLEKNVAVLAVMILLLATGGGALVAYLFKRWRDREQVYFAQIEGQNRELELRNRTIENANQLKTRFLATVSHELRTPLNAVLGFATLLTEEPALPPKPQRWAAHIREGGRHLLQLVNDLLDISKMEAGRLELNPEVFSVEAIVPQVTATLGPMLQARNIRLRVEVQPGLTLRADQTRFRQILYNLLSNAVKFTPMGGDVGVKALRQGDALLMEVRDTGIGIRPEDQEAIFEEFSQRSISETSSPGTGLGLAITRRLVEQHGGHLWVNSAVGQGSCFSFTIPLGCEHEENQFAVRAQEPEGLQAGPNP
ncbi:MAG: sensor histidine kinase [Acidobacteria bacterium]|nr:sensor histidine kinase [Acidobacteriota bacterium]